MLWLLGTVVAAIGVIVWMLWEIHAKLIGLAVRVTEIQTDLISDKEAWDRVSVPGGDVTPKRMVLHDILDKLSEISDKLDRLHR